ncbi:hypothetical protein TNCV_74681 [Trichonephila clavipes]|nr:hypothetical protein TNCV_74681 [Trichonephila clavipes]
MDSPAENCVSTVDLWSSQATEIRSERRIQKLVKPNRKGIVPQIAGNHNQIATANVSELNVHRKLHRIGNDSQIPAEEPVLLALRKNRRFQFTEVQKNWAFYVTEKWPCGPMSQVLNYNMLMLRCEYGQNRMKMPRQRMSKEKHICFQHGGSPDSLGSCALAVRSSVLAESEAEYIQQYKTSWDRNPTTVVNMKLMGSGGESMKDLNGVPPTTPKRIGMLPDRSCGNLRPHYEPSIKKWAFLQHKYLQRLFDVIWRNKDSLHGDYYCCFP